MQKKTIGSEVKFHLLEHYLMQNNLSNNYVPDNYFYAIMNK